MLPAIAAAAATAGGSIIQGIGNVLAGNQAAQVTRETNAMTVDLANTAHQREMADLKAAGLNPLLTATGGQGSETPTLKAPTQAAEGGARAAESMGNAMQILPAAIMQFMTGQQQIEKLRAETEKTAVDTEAVKEALPYIAPKAAMDIKEGAQRVTESTARTDLAKAETATKEMMRIPQLRSIIQQTAESAQRTKTEEQRTKEMTEVAANARALYGAKANEAVTLANQAATYYKEFFMGEHKQKMDTRDLEIELLKNKNFQQVIQNILDNDYGRAERWGKIMDNPMKAGAVLSNATQGYRMSEKARVTNQR